jgi:hypothetical protein
VTRSLPLHSVRAINRARESENKIHDDRVASQYGFRGGLVPGVTVYGYMTEPLVEFAPEWLERGWMQVRFLEPFYEGDTVVVNTDIKDAIVITAAGKDGKVRATASARITPAPSPVPTPYPTHQLPPMDQRPVPSTASIVPGTTLGTIVERLDFNDGRLPTERLLQLSNEMLVRNLRLGPWIHVSSEIQNWGLAGDGDEIAARGRVHDRFDRKGHEFVVVDTMLIADGGRLIQTVRHTAIYQPRVMIDPNQEDS